MYELKVRQIFSGAHFLRNYKGKCERLHGHNWTVWLYVKGMELDSSGMLLDFKWLKEGLKWTLAELDHHNLNELPAFCEQNPSAENIARYIYEKCETYLSRLELSPLVKMEKVEVYETENACACYRKES